MSKIINFKPRTSLPAHELPHYHAIVCDLSELTPQDRLSVIAASCGDDEWQEIFELVVYGFVAELLNQNRSRIRQRFYSAIHSTVEKVISQATGAQP